MIPNFRPEHPLGESLDGRVCSSEQARANAKPARSPILLRVVHREKRALGIETNPDRFLTVDTTSPPTLPTNTRFGLERGRGTFFSRALAVLGHREVRTLS